MAQDTRNDEDQGSGPPYIVYRNPKDDVIQLVRRDGSRPRASPWSRTREPTQPRKDGMAEGCRAGLGISHPDQQERLALRCHWTVRDDNDESAGPGRGRLPLGSLLSRFRSRCPLSARRVWVSVDGVPERLVVPLDLILEQQPVRRVQVERALQFAPGYPRVGHHQRSLLLLGQPLCSGALVEAVRCDARGTKGERTRTLGTRLGQAVRGARERGAGVADWLGRCAATVARWVSTDFVFGFARGGANMTAPCSKALRR